MSRIVESAQLHKQLDANAKLDVAEGTIPARLTYCASALHDALVGIRAGKGDSLRDVELVADILDALAHAMRLGEAS